MAWPHRACRSGFDRGRADSGVGARPRRIRCRTGGCDHGCGPHRARVRDADARRAGSPTHRSTSTLGARARLRHRRRRPCASRSPRTEPTSHARVAALGVSHPRAANRLPAVSVLGRTPFAAIADVVARRGGEHACSRAKGGRNEHSDCSPRSRCRRAAAEAWTAPAPSAAQRRLVGCGAYMGCLAPRVRIGACRAGAPALADGWRRETGLSRAR
jgi:hypothetical protein